MLDKNGMPITEEVEIKIPAFRVVPVFDVSQTDGKELPDIGVNELSGSVEDYEDFMQALTEVSPVPITYEDIDGDAKGYFHTTDHRIAIQEGMSQSQTVKTAIHEVAHAKLHDREQNQDIDAVLDKDRTQRKWKLRVLPIRCASTLALIPRTIPLGISPDGAVTGIRKN